MTHCKKRRVVWLGTSLVLACAILVEQQAQAMAALPFPLMSNTNTLASAPSPEQPEVAQCQSQAGIVVGIAVLAIGLFEAYKLWKFCSVHFPPPATPPPPPPTPIPTNSPPPVPPTTNGTPGTNKSMVFAMDAGVPILPTNTPPICTNCDTPPLKPFFWVPSSWPVNAVAAKTTNAGTFDLGYDIGALNYMDTNNGVVTPYLYYVESGVTNFQSSTNARDWSNYKMTMWVSGAGVVTLLSDGQGQGVLTNYTKLGGALNLQFGIWVTPANRQKFVRFIP